MKPRLLDLFCGAGGAAKGYQLAGFHVTGIDHVAQPNYCGDEFVQDDALSLMSTYPWWDVEPFDAIHASPPCQAHSSIARQQRIRRPDRYEHPDLVAATRERLLAAGVPYVIENVPGAPLLNPVQLCGSWFGLDLARHRLFETSFPMTSTPCSHHWQEPRFRSLDKRRKGLARVVGVHGHLNYAGEREIREAAMGIDWMTPAELSQAIPPAYTEWIGEQLLSVIYDKQAA